MTTAPGRIEVSAAEFELHRKATALLDSLWNDPKHGIDVKRLVEAKTGVRSPELALIESVTKPRDEAITALQGEVRGMKAAREAEAKAAEDARAEAVFTAEIEATQKRYGFTEDGMQKVFDRMKAKKNPDVEAAAAWVLSQEPKSKPVTGSPYAPQTMNLYGVGEQDEKWADLNKDPVRFFDKECWNVLQEFANAQ